MFIMKIIFNGFMSIFVQKTRVFEVFHGKYFFPFFVFNKVKMVYLINGILKLLEQIYIGVYIIYTYT